MPQTPLLETADLADLPSNTYRVIETGMTRHDYEAGHIEGGVFWPLSELVTSKLASKDFRLRTEPEHFADLLSRSGITPETWVVCTFPNDKAGWAAWLFWILTSFGHTRTLILNGGTAKWRAEGRPVCGTDTLPASLPYPVPERFTSDERAFLADVRAVVQNPTPHGPLLCDARSRAEFDGVYFFDAPPQNGERAGHIPGALPFPHTELLQANATFHATAELTALCEKRGISADREIFTYCAVGIRSAMLWFAFKHLLGFERVRNYDGSWNEWSRTEGNP